MQLFRQANAPRLPASVTSAIAASRSNGTLSLCDKGLVEVPQAAYDPAAPLDTNVKWWEVAPLTKVDLARNAISALPDALCSLESITYLDVSANQLRQLPNNLPAMLNLKALDLSKNQLVQLPENLAEVTALCTLNLSDNTIRVLPIVLGAGYPRMAVLSANNNQIESLPSALGKASSLTQLSLQGNRLTTINPEVLKGLRNLQELNVSQNAVFQLPPEIGMLTSMRMLWLRENQLTALPPEIAGCASLVELHLGYNKLTSIPSSVGMLSALRVLDVRNNQLRDLPPKACELQLNLLDLSNNNLSNLPPQLGFMTTLRSLPLEGNPMRTIRRELVSGPLSQLLKYLQSRMPENGGTNAVEAAPYGAESGYTPSLTRNGSSRPARINSIIDPTMVRSGNVFGVNETALAAEMARKVALGPNGQELNLANRNLRDVPEDVWKAKDTLWKLDLSGNKVGSIPSQELIGFSNLRFLALNAMGLTAWPLPAATNSLPVLEELQARQNPFQVMPRSAFIACPLLKRLDLSGVLATALMPVQTMVMLTRLESLDLSCTMALEVPPDVLQLINLRTLNMSSCKLEDLPNELSRLVRLEELDLTNNALINLPSQMGMMPSLRILRLEGNPLKPIRRQILEKGTPAVLEYLRSKLPENNMSQSSMSQRMLSSR